MTNKKTFDELKADFKKVVEESSSFLPRVGIDEEDVTSELKWSSLILRAGVNEISGPYRALKLIPDKKNSEGVVTKKTSARKMAEAFFKFDEDQTELLFDEVENKNDAIAPIKENLENQLNQVKDDAFKIIQFGFSVEDDRLTPDGDWIDVLINILSKSGANLLFFVPPRFVENVEEIVKYQIAAMKANLNLKNPMYVAGYVPTLSPKQSIKLEDVYLETGINTIIYDFKKRPPNDSSLSHLVALSSQLKKPPIYIHGLNVPPKRKAMPFDSIYDLWLPSFGIQSISNTRRFGGGSSKKNKKKISDLRLVKPVRCIHGYYLPVFGQFHNKKFVCQKCNIQEIEDAFDEDVKVKLYRACDKYNAEISCKEMKIIAKRIKEKSLRNYLYKKEGLKPIEYSTQLERFEKTVKHEKQKLSVKKLDEWL